MKNTTRALLEIAGVAVEGLQRRRDEEEKSHTITRVQMSELARAALTVVDEIDGNRACAESVDSLRAVLRKLEMMP